MPECQKLKNDGLDQYGAEPFEQQELGTAGDERVNLLVGYDCVTLAALAFCPSWVRATIKTL